MVLWKKSCSRRWESLLRVTPSKLSEEIIVKSEETRILVYRSSRMSLYFIIQQSIKYHFSSLLILHSSLLSVFLLLSIHFQLEWTGLYS